MTTGTKAIVRTTYWSLLLVAVLTSVSCIEIDPPNMPPTARVTVMLGGMALAPTAIMGVTAPAYMIMGAGQSVTLQGAGTDPDGMITSYQWWRTDVSRTMRNPPMMAPPAGGTGAAGTGGMGAAGMGAGGTGMGAGGMAAPPPPPFTGDPPRMPTVEVMLPVVGNYRYSLWVTDDGDLASAPATVTLVVR
jgi:hypothetical protein